MEEARKRGLKMIHSKGSFDLEKYPFHKIAIYTKIKHHKVGKWYEI